MKADFEKNKHKIEDVENSIKEVKLSVNSKINGEQVRDIIDKKLLIL